MKKIATITSKRQLTIPADIFSKTEFKSNSKVVVELTEEGLLVKPAKNMLEEIGGSVTVPESKKGISAEKAIKESKNKYFKDKNK